jgi:hypothetical protein
VGKVNGRAKLTCKNLMSDYLIWSNEYRAWLGPGRNRYAARVEHASRYTQEQALRICTESMPATARWRAAA